MAYVVHEYNHPTKGVLRGKIVRVIPAGNTLPDDEVLKYGGIEPSNRHWKWIKGPHRVSMSVFECSTGFYIIGPSRDFKPLTVNQQQGRAVRKSEALGAPYKIKTGLPDDMMDAYRYVGTMHENPNISPEQARELRNKFIEGSEYMKEFNKRIMGDFPTASKCTCGIDAVGGGKHSSWCDKEEL